MRVEIYGHETLRSLDSNSCESEGHPGRHPAGADCPSVWGSPGGRPSQAMKIRRRMSPPPFALHSRLSPSVFLAPGLSFRFLFLLLLSALTAFRPCPAPTLSSPTHLFKSAASLRPAYRSQCVENGAEAVAAAAANAYDLILMVTRPRKPPAFPAVKLRGRWIEAAKRRNRSAWAIDC